MTALCNKARNPRLGKIFNLIINDNSFKPGSYFWFNKLCSANLDMLKSRMGNHARMDSNRKQLVLREGMVSPAAHMAGPKVDTGDATMVILEYIRE